MADALPETGPVIELGTWVTLGKTTPGLYRVEAVDMMTHAEMNLKRVYRLARAGWAGSSEIRRDEVDAEVRVRFIPWEPEPGTTPEPLDLSAWMTQHRQGPAVFGCPFKLWAPAVYVGSWESDFAGPVELSCTLGRDADGNMPGLLPAEASV
jgi:hypothetical protein